MSPVLYHGQSRLNLIWIGPLADPKIVVPKAFSDIEVANEALGIIDRPSFCDLI